MNEKPIPEALYTCHHHCCSEDRVHVASMLWWSDRVCGWVCEECLDDLEEHQGEKVSLSLKEDLERRIAGKIAKQEADIKALTYKMTAWHQTFGTTQLTHARAMLESKDKRIAELEAACRQKDRAYAEEQALRMSLENTEQDYKEYKEVEDPIYPVACRNCGWEGSSKDCPCIDDWFTCPKCFTGEPEEVDVCVHGVPKDHFCGKCEEIMDKEWNAKQYQLADLEDSKQEADVEEGA